MLVSRALLLLCLDVLIFAALGFWLHQGGHPAGEGLLWGTLAGAVCAVSAIGGAWFTEVKRLPTNAAVGVVVAGFLARLFFIGAVAFLAFTVGKVDGLGFIGGFAAVYLPGQVLEVWMLFRLKGGARG